MGGEIYNRDTTGKTAVKPVISLRNVSKRFGNKKVLNNVSFEVNKGEIVSLIGPNGAGKTTSIRIILGLLVPDSGNVCVYGNNPLSRESSIRKISAVLEKDVLWDKLTGIENISVASYLWGLRREEAIEKAVEYAKLFKLEKSLKYPVFSYSKGMKRKLSVILSLVKDPALLVLDEPNSGIDTESRIDIRETLLAFKKNGGTILVTSHDLEEMEKLADRVLIINKGQIVFSSSSDSIKSTGLFVVKVGLGNKRNFSEFEEYLVGKNIPYEINNSVLIAEVRDKGNFTQQIAKIAIEKGYLIKEIKEKQKSLERMYMDITKEESGGNSNDWKSGKI